MHASGHENAELFWGLRGGGGNFGGAHLAFAAWAPTLPEDMNPIISFPVFPPEFGMGRDPWMIIGFMWVAKDHRAGLSLVEQLTAGAPPDEQEVGPVSWLDWQSAMDSVFPKGSRGYWKNVSFSRLGEETVGVLLGFASELPWEGTGKAHDGGTGAGGTGGAGRWFSLLSVAEDVGVRRSTAQYV